MALFSTLYTAFGGASLDSQFSSSGSPISLTEGSGYLTINCDTTSGGVVTAATYDLTGSSVQFQLNSTSEPGRGYFSINAASGDRPCMRWVGDLGKWQAGYAAAGFPVEDTNYSNSATSGSTGRPYGRMIDTGSVVVCEESADGSTWHNLWTSAITPPTAHAFAIHFETDGAAADFKVTQVGLPASNSGAMTLAIPTLAGAGKATQSGSGSLAVPIPTLAGPAAAILFRPYFVTG